MSSNRQLIETDIGSPSDPGESTGRQVLPDDLLRQAAHRLGVVCLVMSGLVIANFLLVHLIFPLPDLLTPEELAINARWRPVYNAVGSAVLAVSLGLYWYTRRRQASPRFIIDLALGYEVLTALSIGLLNYAVKSPKEGLSWIAVLILIFPAIVPSTPRKALATGLLAASMDPVGALIAKAIGVQGLPAMGRVMLLATPNYLCAGVATVISRIITGLGREVRKAREMGSYVLGERIGSGGMGEVWHATHRFLVRPAAIKLIKPECSVP